MTHCLTQLTRSLALTFETQILQVEASSSMPHTISAVFGEDQVTLPEMVSIRRFQNWLTRFVANCLSLI